MWSFNEEEEDLFNAELEEPEQKEVKPENYFRLNGKKAPPIKADKKRMVVKDSQVTVTCFNRREFPQKDSGQEFTYTILRNISKGYFSTVDKVLLPDEKCAVVKTTKYGANCTLNELMLLMQLRHSNIVDFYCYFYSPGGSPKETNLNLVLEYVPLSLANLLNQYIFCRQTLMPSMYVKFYAYQLFRALGFIHSFKLCHRNVSTSSILINHSVGVLKLCDFSYAKLLEPGKKMNAYYRPSNPYGAPELLFRSVQYNDAIDIWGAGSVVAEMLLGRPAFIDSNIHSYLGVLGAPTVKDVRGMNPELTEVIEVDLGGQKSYSWDKLISYRKDEVACQFLSRLLVYNPDKRPSALETCTDEFFDDLRKPDQLLPNGKVLPPFIFYMSSHELGQQPRLNSTLVPKHIELPNEKKVTFQLPNMEAVAIEMPKEKFPSPTTSPPGF